MGGQWLTLSLSGVLTRHGESLQRVAAWSVLTIPLSAVLYPWVGGIDGPNGDVIRLTLTDSFDPVGVAAAYWQSLYFSVITFSTIGYGNLAPNGVGSQPLVGVESLAGAMLVALFIFVLGRRTAR